jgi:hypothetical protein
MRVRVWRVIKERYDRPRDEIPILVQRYGHHGLENQVRTALVIFAIDIQQVIVLLKGEGPRAAYRVSELLVDFIQGRALVRGCRIILGKGRAAHQ